MAKILIVDDAAFMRNVLKGILEKNGYEVVGEATNGNEGFEQYKLLKPDLTLLDITMPESDGISCLKKIREFDPDAVCVMCSAMGQQVMVVEAIKSGAKDFIVKPFEAERVVSSVGKFV